MNPNAEHNRRSGFIPLYRSVADNPLWTAERFSKGQAWVDLLLLASHKPTTFFKRGSRVDLERGQLGRSKKELQDRWSWCEDRLNRFLNDLVSMEQIKVQSSNVTTVITVLLYDNYNSIGEQTEVQSKVQTKVQSRDIQQVNKEKRRGLNTPPSLDEVVDFFNEQSFHSDPAEWHSYWVSVDWMRRNGLRIKNWRAAARNHEIKRTNQLNESSAPKALAYSIDDE